MKYYIRTTHNIDGTYKGSDYEKQTVWQYADIGFVGHMLEPYKYMSIEDVRRAIEKYNKDNSYDDGWANLSTEQLEACLIILVKFGMAEELK